MARQTFTAGAVLTATQMNTLQASVWSDDVNAQTTSYTLVLTDAGKQVTMTSSSATTITVPANATVAFAVGAKIQLINLGAGVITIAGTGAATIYNSTLDLSLNQYAVGTLYKTATDTWVLFRGMDVEDDQAILSSQIFG
jgi:hypothetical protein